MSQPDRPSVALTVDIDAEVERVWQSLVTDGGLGPWMGDGATIDPRPGGRLSFPDVVGGRARHGRVRQVEDGRRLEFVWWAAAEPTRRSTVTITVAPAQTGSRVTVIETISPPAPVGFAAVSASAAQATVPSPRPVSAGRSKSVIGAWSWRLALLTLSSQMTRV